MKKRKWVIFLGGIICFFLIVLCYNIFSKKSSGMQTDNKNIIKWVDFNVTAECMAQAANMDIETYQGEIHSDWIALLAYAAVKGGGNFNSKSKEYIAEANDLLLSKKATVQEWNDNLKYYHYYYEVYQAVLSEYLGEYVIEEITENGEKCKVKKYGLKVFHPIAKGFPYEHYDDFGTARSYGYSRPHLGHDMMGQIGTPVIAVESGYVEALGWNQYGGWRIGIRSFDKKRYYYYAHLRQNRPYAEGLKEGDYVTAGDVIGYMGHTGYSKTENVNNIKIPHLHLGIELIFDESQKDSDSEIWINCYEIVRFLQKNQSEVFRNDATKEWKRVYLMENDGMPQNSQLQKQKVP